MIVLCKEYVLASEVRIADDFVSRFKGLMGKKSLDDGEGLLLMRCSSIHCFFMKIPIDVAYLSEDMTVLGLETLKPWSVGRNVKGTVHVLELGAGKALVSIGDKLEIDNQFANGI